MRRYQNVRGDAIKVLRQAQGKIRSDIPAKCLTIMHFAMMDGLRLQWLLEPGIITMARIFGQLVQLLLGGMRAAIETVACASGFIGRYQSNDVMQQQVDVKLADPRN